MAQITEQTYKAYAEELQELYDSMEVKEQRVKDARALGDISENEEYASAQDDLNNAQSRIFYLEDICRTAQVVRDMGGNEISIASYIRVTEVTKSGETLAEPKLFILDSVERYLDGHLGTESPLGKAILNNVSKQYAITTSHGHLKYYRVMKEELTDEIEKEFKDTYGAKVFG